MLLPNSSKYNYSGTLKCNKWYFFYFKNIWFIWSTGTWSWFIIGYQEDYGGDSCVLRRLPDESYIGWREMTESFEMKTGFYKRHLHQAASSGTKTPRPRRSGFVSRLRQKTLPVEEMKQVTAFIYFRKLLQTSHTVELYMDKAENLRSLRDWQRKLLKISRHVSAQVRYILGVWWPVRASNENLKLWAKQNIKITIQWRKWRRIGHILSNAITIIKCQRVL